ncbi:MAG: hypothetical protein WCI95_03080 [bacterium]
MSKAKQMEHGGSSYNYSTGKVGTQGKKPESKGPSMGRKVMPGDAHESMEKRTGKKGC